MKSYASASMAAELREHRGRIAAAARVAVGAGFILISSATNATYTTGVLGTLSDHHVVRW
jgi:hypothetical protein